MAFSMTCSYCKSRRDKHWSSSLSNRPDLRLKTDVSGCSNGTALFHLPLHLKVCAASSMSVEARISTVDSSVPVSSRGSPQSDPLCVRRYAIALPLVFFEQTGKPIVMDIPHQRAQSWYAGTDNDHIRFDGGDVTRCSETAKKTVGNLHGPHLQVNRRP